jgi:hypothetical protein
MKLPIVALLLLVCPALAQDAEDAPDKAAKPKPTLTDGCPTGIDFDKAGYKIRDVRVENPFEFLPWIAPAVRNARAAVASLKDTAFTNETIDKAKKDVFDKGFLPDAPDQRVIIDLMITSVENCSGKQLDLVFWMLSSQIAAARSGTLEAVEQEKSTPQTSAGADAVKKKLQVFPAVGYNHTDRLFAGGSAQYVNAGRFPLGKLAIDGAASSSMHQVHAALSGAHDSPLGWVTHSEWELNYQSSSEPSLDTRVGQNRVAGQFSAISRAPLLLRFGASLEGGNLQSAPSSVALAPETINGSGYGSLKLFLGKTGRWQNIDKDSIGKAVPFNSYSASYGVELGSTDAGSNLSWIKHVADVADDLTLPFGDHRSVDLESRFMAGFIQVRSPIPQAVRFLGGNRLTPFISGNDWGISSNPFIRSIPANRLATTAEGFGGTRFITFNSTLSVATWRWPLVPPEVTGDRGFPDALESAFAVPTSLLDAGYRTKDPHYTAMVTHIPAVRSALGKLKTAVTAAQTGATPQTASLFKACNRFIGLATVRADSAAQDKGQAQYGDIGDLLQDEPSKPGAPPKPDPKEKRNLLHRVHEACGNLLNAQINDPKIGDAANELENQHAAMESEFTTIDRSGSAAKAKADMAFPRATLNTLLYQVNLFSLSPVIVFDFAHLGPASSSLGTRYGIGGGVRADLVSHVNFTIGYAANPKRLPNEGKGALFFSMGLKQLF